MGVFFMGETYRGTSLTRNRTPLGPYRKPMPRVLRGCKGGGRFFMGEVPRSSRLPPRLQPCRQHLALLPSLVPRLVPQLVQFRLPPSNETSSVIHGAPLPPPSPWLPLPAFTAAPFYCVQPRTGQCMGSLSVRNQGRMPVACLHHACVDPSRAVTLPNIGVPHHMGVPHRVTYPQGAFLRSEVPL